MINKFVKYLKEAKQELRKVSWPSKKDLKNHTLLVIGISLGVAIFLGIVDFILTKVLQIFIK
ncbi:preprotein translocase subunit SecE [bacterium]|nr:preprotein translocase subunit SecE [bacterium]